MNSPLNFFGKVAIKIFLEDEEKNLLVVKQHENEDYEIVGGRVDEGESIYQTISREVEEELRFNISHKDFKIIDSFQANNPNENVKHLYILVSIKVTNEEKSKMKTSEEVKEIVWVSRDNYQSYKYKTFLKEYIKNFINQN